MDLITGMSLGLLMGFLLGCGIALLIFNRMRRDTDLQYIVGALLPKTETPIVPDGWINNDNGDGRWSIYKSGSAKDNSELRGVIDAMVKESGGTVAVIHTWKTDPE